MIALYLLAIVAANLVVGHFGPSASIWTAFLLIGLDLTARDSLHERWQGNNLVRNMFLLIVTGSALTVALNWGAWRIALASCAAFILTAAIDSVVYQRLFKRARFVKVNGSNVFSSAVDSLAFPMLAFGWPPLWAICGGQFVAKVFGGLLWSFLLRNGSNK